ncbi:MAG: Uma2 family endonuclease [Planctomycetes bacterium]|nr:Uma2 family endonuclease [Planctomycetota bacterium]
MASALEIPAPPDTVGELLARLGGVPAHRVRLNPAPGTATEKDVLAIHAREKRLYELVDGVLVEKGMGYAESMLAGAVISCLRAFVRPRKLGLVSGESGMIRLMTGLVRIPDATFISWDRIPGRRVPKAPIPPIPPNLAVEILSKSNTRAEMRRKLREYFAAGVELVWLIDPRKRTVEVYASPRQRQILTANDVLDGGTVLPGFVLPLAELFSELDEQGE